MSSAIPGQFPDLLKSNHEESTSSILNDPEKQCWICLGTDSEPPPLNNPKGHEWIHPCRCSLLAHRTCLLEWINELEKNNGNETDNVIVANDEINHSTQGKGPFFIKKDENTFIYSGITCPQCSQPIYITIARSKVLTTRKKIENTILTSSFSILMSTLATGTITVVYFILMGAGASVTGVMCSQDTFLHVMGIRRRAYIFDTYPSTISYDILPPSSPQAIRRGLLITWIPFYLLTIRRPLGFNFSNITTFICPLMLYDRHDLSPKRIWRLGGPRLLCVAVPFLRLGYKVWYNFVVNYFYYKLAVTVRPHLLENDIENNSNAGAVLNDGEIVEVNQQPSLVQRLYNNTKNLLGRLFTINHGSFAILPRTYFSKLIHKDYSDYFYNSTILFNLASTWIWPYVGSIIGRAILPHIKIPSILLKNPTFNSFRRRIYSNYDRDFTFTRNIIGCCLVVLLKDVVNVYTAYKKVEQIKRRQILKYKSEDWEVVDDISKNYHKRLNNANPINNNIGDNINNDNNDNNDNNNNNDGFDNINDDGMRNIRFGNLNIRLNF